MAIKKMINKHGKQETKKFFKNTIEGSNFTKNLIDEYKIDGDFIESQAFAFLAIRSYLGLPISFPSTTNCKTPTVGGTIIKNS